MASSREDRLVENEKIFRAANERLRGRAEAISPSSPSVPFICECIDDGCMQRVELTFDEYDRVRADDEHFFIAPGHPVLDGERVVEDSGDFLVVSKADLD